MSNLIVFYKYGVKVFIANDNSELTALLAIYITNKFDWLGYAVLKVQSE